MRRATRLAITAVTTAAILGLAFAAFLYGFEKGSRQVEVGYGPEARRNPYLAAARLLRRMGLDVEVVGNAGDLRALPPPGTTLLVPVPRRSFEARAPELVSWIRAGGHLIVVPDDTDRPAGDDALLDAYGVGAAPSHDLIAGVPVEVEWPGGPVLSGHLGGGVVLTQGARRAEWRVAGGEGALVLHYRDGRGSLTVVATGAFMTNELIGEADNARLLWRLVSAASADGPVILLIADDAPGLLAVLWRARAAAMVCAACLLAALVWRDASRLGPVRPAGDPPRRSLREHVEASGRFLWRTGAAAALVTAVREALARELLRRHPDWAAQPAAELERRIALLLSPRGDATRPQAAALAMTAATRETAAARIPEKRFVETVASMERLRRSL